MDTGARVFRLRAFDTGAHRRHSCRLGAALQNSGLGFGSRPGRVGSGRAPRKVTLRDAPRKFGRQADHRLSARARGEPAQPSAYAEYTVGNVHSPKPVQERAFTMATAECNSSGRYKKGSFAMSRSRSVSHPLAARQSAATTAIFANAAATCERGNCLDK